MIREEIKPIILSAVLSLAALFFVEPLVASTLSTPSTPSTPSRKEERLELKISILQSQLDEARRLRGATTSSTTSSEQMEATAEEDGEDLQGLDDATSLNGQAEARFAFDSDPTISFNAIQIDSLLDIWRVREANEHYDNYFNQYIFIDTDEEESMPIDTLYKLRLQNLASPIELPYNSIVRSYINRYTNPSSKLMSNIITRSQYFFPDIENQLIKAGLPVELRAMAIVESALLNKAVSHAGAAGLWQFMPSTGISYGLEVNSLVDERCDPVKSTIAACRFLTDLYNMYDNWSLALAAYNCGPGNVNKAIARTGLKEGTFWDIYYHLPRETRGYVPAFIGASYGYAYHREHNIEMQEKTLPLATDTVTVSRILHLGQVAEVLDIPIEILRELNPQYRRDIIPATRKQYSLRLPQRYVCSYIENEELIHSKDSVYLEQYVNPTNIDRLLATPHNLIHRVKSGETLSGIAKKYRVTTRQLMTWNKLSSPDKISIGQKLRVSN